MSHKDGIKKLIKEHSRHLQKLKEQQAKFGLHTPTHILTEIEDREEEIEKLEAELLNLEDDAINSNNYEEVKSRVLRTRFLIVGAAGLFVLGLIGVFLNSWIPDTASTVNEIARFEVLSTEQKNRTGMLVTEGEVIHFEYLDGQWAGTIDVPQALIGCGSKLDMPKDQLWPLPFEGTVGALIGYIDDQTPFLIGCKPIDIEVPNSGELSLGVNDCSGCFWDNRGEIFVRISKNP